MHPLKSFGEATQVLLRPSKIENGHLEEHSLQSLLLSDLKKPTLTQKLPNGTDHRKCQSSEGAF